MENKNLKYLFEDRKMIKVPSYQRAYSWGENQLDAFVGDLNEFAQKEGYYFGHFIFEETNEAYEIIDGQQRITTFILFLMVCKLYVDESEHPKFNLYLERFETVDYDQKLLSSLMEKVTLTDGEWNLENFVEVELGKATLSSKNIVFALNYFRKAFDNTGAKISLDKQQIDKYTGVIEFSHISVHITKKKDVAVQIFEMHNTRGVKLNLLEKVKAKLMKAVFISLGSDNCDTQISQIQNYFKIIYYYEELVKANSFRGELSIEELLLLHLRIVDDGSKLKTGDKNVFATPGKTENRETAVLNYIDEKIHHLISEPEKVVNYVIELSSRFTETVEFICENLPALDSRNPLIGDTLILARDLSVEFFILLFHANKSNELENKEFVRLWEKLLFTRDFHDKYYKLVYRDDFDRLYRDIVEAPNIVEKLKEYVNLSFVPDKMDNNSLPLTVSNFINNNEETILTNAFHWWNDKMVYLLYKYEIINNADINGLRSIMKQGRSVEHILPQDWQPLMEEIEINLPEDELKTIREEVPHYINGIGNLLLITGGENSSLKNKHPRCKIYESCEGGSYNWHNDNPEQWNSPKDWKKIIKEERGKKIFDFLIEFVEN